MNSEENFLEIGNIIQQINRHINDMLRHEGKDLMWEKRRKIILETKDRSTSGDKESRNIMKEFIKCILTEGFNIYETYIDGTLSDRLLYKDFFLNEEDSEIDKILPFNEKEKLTSRDRFEILLYLFSGSQTVPRNLGFKNLYSEIENKSGIAIDEISSADIEKFYLSRIITLSFEKKLDVISQRIYSELFGLKALDILAYSDINEVGFSDDGKYVYCWNGEKIHLSFLKIDEDNARIIQERAISFDKNAGALSENNPEVLCHRFDGARVTVTQRPYFSARNCCIRIFNQDSSKVDEIMADERLKLLTIALVKSGQSCIFQGGLGTGKSTYMSMLYGILDKNLHVGLLEDMFELHIMEKHGENLRVVEAQRTTSKTLQNGVETFLRMSVDVAGLGEARSGEALFSFIQLVQSVSVAAWVTAQVNSPENTVSRLKNMLMGTGIYSDETAAAVDVVNNINFIFQNSIVGNERKISEICEIVPGKEQVRYGSIDFNEMEQKELEREYYIYNLRKDISNIYSLNKIYEIKGMKGRYINYPSQKFIDRSKRFPTCKKILIELLAKIEEDVGYEHELNLWWS